MTAPAIRVEGLGKRYVLGRSLEPNRTLGETLADSARRAVGRLRRGARTGDAQSFWALQDATFDVPQGEAVGLIGGNGAGKSTLLKLLSRVTAPTTGRGEIRGRVGSLLEVGTGFHPDLTGRENVFLNGAILGMRRAEILRRFDEIVAFAEVERFIDTPVKRYSSGMYLRLAFAVAAHLEPEVLLVDEVLAVGDAAFQQKCLGKMGDVTRAGRTVVFVSHNLVAIQALCSRAIQLQQGRVVADGPSRAVVDAYLASRHVDTSAAVPGDYDLTSRENEYTRGRLFLRRVVVTDGTGSRTNGVPMGAPVRVAIEVAALSEVPGGVVGLKVKSEAGDALLYFNTAMRAPRRVARGGGAWIVVDLPRVPLTPGSYWIDVSLFTEASGRLDYVERAFRLRVWEADVFESGYRVTEGVIYPEVQWELASAPPTVTDGAGDSDWITPGDA